MSFLQCAVCATLEQWCHVSLTLTDLNMCVHVSSCPSSQIGWGRSEPRLGSNLLSGAQGFLEVLPSLLHSSQWGHHPFLNTHMHTLTDPHLLPQPYSHTSAVLQSNDDDCGVCMCVCIVRLLGGCYWASVLALHLWPLSFFKPDAMLCYRTWAHAGNRHTRQKWSRLILKGPNTHTPGHPAVNLTCTDGLCLCSCCLKRDPDIVAQIHLWKAMECLSAPLMMFLTSSKLEFQLYFMSAAWKTICGSNKFSPALFSFQEGLLHSPPVSPACVKGNLPQLCLWACPSPACLWLM